MMFPRFFSPTVTSRLFDPMPLPRAARLRGAKRVGVSHAKLPRTATFAAVNFTVKKIPANR